MLAIIDNLLADVRPVLEIPEYSLRAEGRQLVLYANGHAVISGVTFYRMSNNRHTDLNPVTGEFQITNGRPSKFRAVFAGQHLDLEVTP